MDYETIEPTCAAALVGMDRAEIDAVKAATGLDEATLDRATTGRPVTADAANALYAHLRANHMAKLVAIGGSR